MAKIDFMLFLKFTVFRGQFSQFEISDCRSTTTSSTRRAPRASWSSGWGTTEASGTTSRTNVAKAGKGQQPPWMTHFETISLWPTSAPFRPSSNFFPKKFIDIFLHFFSTKISASKALSVAQFQVPGYWRLWVRRFRMALKSLLQACDDSSGIRTSLFLCVALCNLPSEHE